MNEVQLDLFGAVERREAQAAQREDEEQQVAAEREQARQEWEARFERAPWIAPYDTAGGLREGDSVLGWRCPDPECGEVEPNAFVLHINHGFDPTVPGRQRHDGRCSLVVWSGVSS